MAELLIGIPSYNNAGTIAHVVQAAIEGARRHHPDLYTVIYNSDGGSSDGTAETVTAQETSGTCAVHTHRYEGPSGKGSAFRDIFAKAVEVGARACVVMDADLRSVTPDWIARLADPVLDGTAAMVTPLYVRDKYDGTITNNLCYPVVRALYGRRVRQPIGGDFGLSPELAEALLVQDVWSTDVSRFGIDIFMTLTALGQNFPVVQAGLGAKVHDAKDPGADLGPMFTQVVGTLFDLAARYRQGWLDIKGSAPVPVVGSTPTPRVDPVKVDLPSLDRKFRNGLEEESAILNQVLSEETRDQARAAAEAGRGLPSPTWVRAVYEVMAAYPTAGPARPQILDMLTGLYFGRVAAFAREAADMDQDQAEQVVERQAEQFESEKWRLVTASG